MGPKGHKAASRLGKDFLLADQSQNLMSCSYAHNTRFPQTFAPINILCATSLMAWPKDCMSFQ